MALQKLGAFFHVLLLDFHCRFLMETDASG